MTGSSAAIVSGADGVRVPSRGLRAFAVVLAAGALTAAAGAVVAPGLRGVPFVLAPLAAAAVAIEAGSMAPLGARSTWIAITLACLCAALAQAFALMQPADTFPGVTDALSILFHVCLAEASILALRPARDPRLALEIALDGVLVLLAAAVLVLRFQLDGAMAAEWISVSEATALLVGQTAVVGSLLFAALLVLWRDSELGAASIDMLFVAALLFSFGDALGGIGLGAPPDGGRWILDVMRLAAWGVLAAAAVAAWYRRGATVATSRRSGVARRMRLLIGPAALLFMSSWAVVPQGPTAMSSLRRATMVALAIVLAARVGVAFFAVEREGRERQAAEALASRARMRAITAQMNPHFLFNTLHSLSALLRRDVSAAESVLERLGRLLRYGLDRGDSLLPLEEEWRFTESYVELEKVRLSSRLRFDARLDDDALDRMVPPFILQPLVENSIRHAIDADPEGGSISVTARIREDAVLVVEVHDSGGGADDQAMSAASGVGVRGVRAQLAAHCGEGAGLQIERPADGGFTIRLLIPPIDE